MALRRPIIRVRYCGGCNPQIDRATLVRDIRTRLSDRVVFKAADRPDLVLRINGCAHACLDEACRSACDTCLISVQGCRVDCRPVAEEKLADAIVASICAELKLTDTDP